MEIHDKIRNFFKSKTVKRNTVVIDGNSKPISDKKGAAPRSKSFVQSDLMEKFKAALRKKIDTEAATILETNKPLKLSNDATGNDF